VQAETRAHHRPYFRPERCIHRRAPLQRRHLQRIEGAGPGAWQTVSGSGPVLLDFSKMDYINSSGIALIIQILMEADKTGQKVAVFGLTPHFQKVFTMVGIGKYAGLHKDEATAAASL